MTEAGTGAGRGPAVGEPRAGTLRLRSTAGRGALFAATLASGLVFLDSTIVNVALPHIGSDLGASMGGLQWMSTGYAVSLASFVLLGGSLGDRYGRRRLFLTGLVWFAVASLLCGLATSVGWLVAARSLQGAGAALLTPGSLAVLHASFHPDDRGRAIGAWSGLSAAFTALGPFVGGWLIDAFSWRWMFLLNVPFAAVAVAAAGRWVPESRGPVAARARFDLGGAMLGVLGLAGVTYALIDAGERGLGALTVQVAASVGVVAAVAFVLVERRRGPAAMLPLRLFTSRRFSVLNLYTVVVYAALSGQLFFLAVYLQNVVGYSALAAGLAGLPVTVVMLAGSARAGALATRVGARLPLVAGPLVASIGLLLLRSVEAGDGYWLHVFPGIVVFGVGLTTLVAPLTAAVLSAAPDGSAGTAGGVSNAAAWTGGLLAVAALPAAVGLSGSAYAVPAQLVPAFRAALLACVGLLVLGAALASRLRR